VQGWVSELDSAIPEGFDAFTRANASEVLPEVLTPLVHSVLFELGERGFQRSAIEAGAWSGPVRTSPPYFQGCFYGRVVLNVSTLLHCAARLPGQDPVALGENYLGETRARDVVVTRDLAVRRLARLPRIVAMVARIRRRAATAVRVTDAFLDDQSPIDSLDADELARSVARTRTVSEDVLVVHLHASSLAGAAYESLGRAVARWRGTPDPALTARLVTGLSTLESTRPTEALWAWSRRLLGDVDQTELVRETPAGALIVELASGETASARTLGDQLERFLDRYGARGPDAGSSWREDPRPVLEMLRGFLDLPEDRCPARVAARQHNARAQAVAELRAGLGVARRLRLRVLLSQTSRYLSLREQLKGAVVQLTSHLRAHAWACADRLVTAGGLDNREDASFLGLDELLDAVAGHGAASLREKVERRRTEYERNLTIQIPETFTGRPEPQPRVVALPTNGDVRELRGIAVSPGRVTASARVIRDLDADDMIEPGEILVAPITDTGWTPLFAFASGLVVDLGGQLSHGSIVAREFGLPAVVNVKVGTSAIATGDTVTVDGDTGVVHIHRAPA